MCWGKKSLEPLDTGGYRTVGKMRPGLQAAQKDQYSPVNYKANVEHAQKMKHWRVEKKVPTQRWLSGAVVCILALCEKMFKICKRKAQARSPWVDGRRLDRARSPCIAYPWCEALPPHLPSVQDRQEWQLQPGRERFLDPLLGSTTASSIHL